MRRGDSTRWICFALGALVLSAAGARAQQPAYDPHQAFREADADHDGSIDLGEFNQRLVDVFYLGDTNKDGKLSKDEYDAIVVIHEEYGDVDHDGDGLISQTEFIRVRLPLFKQSDKNDDGKLSEEEITAVYEARKK